MDKEELERWGFYHVGDKIWYNNKLCMSLTVYPCFRNSELSEYDFIQAVFKHGVECGKSEIKTKIKDILDIQGNKF